MLSPIVQDPEALTLSERGQRMCVVAASFDAFIAQYKIHAPLLALIKSHCDQGVAEHEDIEQTRYANSLVC